jgi:hypothetical protein
VNDRNAEFYSTTRELLIDARRKRDDGLLRRGADRVNGERFNALSDSRQEDLLTLFGEAMMATGMAAP